MKQKKSEHPEHLRVGHAGIVAKEAEAAGIDTSWWHEVMFGRIHPNARGIDINWHSERYGWGFIVLTEKIGSGYRVDHRGHGKEFARYLIAKLLDDESVEWID
jgi:hypothetical protein